MASSPLSDGNLFDSAPASERREHARHKIKLRILVAVGETILPGRSEDISTGGACLFLEDPLPEGLSVAVRFQTPYLDQFKWIDITAKVQYSILTSNHPPYRIGIRIVGADAQARRRLASLIGE